MTLTFGLNSFELDDFQMEYTKVLHGIWVEEGKPRLTRNDQHDFKNNPAEYLPEFIDMVVRKSCYWNNWILLVERLFNSLNGVQMARLYSEVLQYFINDGDPKPYLSLDCEGGNNLLICFAYAFGMDEIAYSTTFDVLDVFKDVENGETDDEEEL